MGRCETLATPSAAPSPALSDGGRRIFDYERLQTFRWLIFDYVRIPSLRHIRDPHSVDSLAQQIVGALTHKPTVWRKWEGQREELAPPPVAGRRPKTSRASSTPCPACQNSETFWIILINHIGHIWMTKKHQKLDF